MSESDRRSDDSAINQVQTRTIRLPHWSFSFRVRQRQRIPLQPTEPLVHKGHGQKQDSTRNPQPLPAVWVTNRCVFVQGPQATRPQRCALITSMSRFSLTPAHLQVQDMAIAAIAYHVSSSPHRQASLSDRQQADFILGLHSPPPTSTCPMCPVRPLALVPFLTLLFLQDDFYSHEETARMCARCIHTLFHCPDQLLPSSSNTPPQDLPHSTYSFHRTRLMSSVTFAALLQRLKARFIATHNSSEHRLFIPAFEVIWERLPSAGWSSRCPPTPSDPGDDGGNTWAPEDHFKYDEEIQQQKLGVKYTDVRKLPYLL